MEAGEKHGLSNAGLVALNGLRLEKGYRHWGHDLDTETSPWEGGLGFTVDMKVCSHAADITVNNCIITY